MSLSLWPDPRNSQTSETGVQRIQPREQGLALVGIVSLLALLGLIVGGLLYLVPSGLRSALVQEDRVRAFDHAESGIHFALTHVQHDADNLDRLHNAQHAFSDGGGFCALHIQPASADDSYTVSATGYQRRGDRFQTHRTSVDFQLPIFVVESVFSRHWQLSGEPGYHWFEMEWEDSWEESPSLPPCVNSTNPGPDADSRDVVHEHCTWRSDNRDYYPGYWNAQRPALIDNATVTVPRNLHISEAHTFEASASTLYVDNDLIFDGGSTSHFRGVTLYIDGDAKISAGASVTFSSGTSLFVDGDFIMDGGTKVRFEDGVTVYVNQNLNISGSAWSSGPGGHDAPWNIFYVRKGVTIIGGAGAGAELPDVALIMHTDQAYNGYPVKFEGSGTVFGGIYAPTRDVNFLYGNGFVHGSIVADRISVPEGKEEKLYEDAYAAVEDRMKTFDLKVGRGRDGAIELTRWREVRSWTAVEGCPPALL